MYEENHSDFDDFVFTVCQRLTDPTPGVFNPCALKRAQKVMSEQSNRLSRLVVNDPTHPEVVEIASFCAILGDMIERTKGKYRVVFGM